METKLSSRFYFFMFFAACGGESIGPDAQIAVDAATPHDGGTMHAPSHRDAAAAHDDAGEVDGASIASQGDAASGVVDAASDLTLSSPAFQDSGTLPVDYTCDGAGVSPPLAWSGIPMGTQELALLMTTEAPDGRKWNWVLYHIPTSADGLSEASGGVGTAGLTSDGPKLAYSPPCSQGPGAKTYTFTLYALSQAPELPASPVEVTGSTLAAAVADRTLGTSQLSVSYTRK